MCFSHTHTHTQTHIYTSQLCTSPPYKGQKTGHCNHIQIFGARPGPERATAPAQLKKSGNDQPEGSIGLLCTTHPVLTWPSVSLPKLCKTLWTSTSQSGEIAPLSFPFGSVTSCEARFERKKHFHHLLKAHNGPSSLASFKEWRSSAKKLLAQDKKTFTDYTELSLLTHSPCEFWRYIKFRTCHARDSITIQDGDKFVSDLEGVCELLARHFSSTYSTSSDSGNELCFQSHGSLLQSPNVTENDVVCASRKLLSKKSSGCDSIPCFIVKGCCIIFALLLSHHTHVPC